MNSIWRILPSSKDMALLHHGFRAPYIKWQNPLTSRNFEYDTDASIAINWFFSDNSAVSLHITWISKILLYYNLLLSFKFKAGSQINCSNSGQMYYFTRTLPEAIKILRVRIPLLFRHICWIMGSNELPLFFHYQVLLVVSLLWNPSLLLKNTKNHIGTWKNNYS